MVRILDFPSLIIYMCLFLITQLGIMSAGILIPLQERLYRQKTALGSFPEARLYPMNDAWLFVGSLLRYSMLWPNEPYFACIFRVLPTALFIFAFTGAYAWVHWIGASSCLPIILAD